MTNEMPVVKRYPEPNASRPFAHMFFFQLSDTSSDLVDRFVSLCEQYLSGHPGQLHFSVGIRALEIHRDVSGTNFEVAVHMIFENIAAFNAYSSTAKHEDFITQSAGMSPVRVVFDSYLRLSVIPAAQAPADEGR